MSDREEDHQDESSWPALAILGPLFVCAPSLWFGGPIGVGAFVLGIPPVAAGILALRIRGDRTNASRNLQFVGLLYLVLAVPAAVIAALVLLG